MPFMETTYTEGMRAFIPSPDDNPDCVPFYRAWRGMENVLGKPVMDRWHHLLHQAICWSLQKPENEQFPYIVRHLRSMVDAWKRPEEPRFWYSSEAQPSEPTEDEARKYFNTEYKRAFPDKRANSKHANQLWAEKREKALAIVTEQYQNRLAGFQQRLQEHDAREKQARQEWINQFWSMAEFEEFVRNLEREYKTPVN